MVEPLYADNHLLIYNKPAGMLAQGDHTGDDTMLDLAERYIRRVKDKKGNVFTGLPHRLDRPTSGCLIIARTSKGLQRMTALFRDRLIEKKYVAVIHGYPDRESSHLSHYLQKPAYTDTGQNKVIVKDEPFDRAKPAKLSYRVLASLETSALVQIVLETGRPHQIRAQMAHIGHPILGDIKYGGQKLSPAYPGLALHAHLLEFIHPIKKELIVVAADLPSHPVYMEYADLYDLDVLLR